MICERGQGSIEYLMILSAALTASSLIVLLATTLFSGYSEPSRLASEKSICATFGIELINYTHSYDDVTAVRSDVSVRFRNVLARCTGVSPLSTSEVSCSVKQKSNRLACFVISVNSSTDDNCYIVESTAC